MRYVLFFYCSTLLQNGLKAKNYFKQVTFKSVYLILVYGIITVNSEALILMDLISVNTCM
jgi:hypothetical protein